MLNGNGYGGNKDVGTARCQRPPDLDVEVEGEVRCVRRWSLEGNGATVGVLEIVGLAMRASQ
jgi:hypothetical protein